jgi:rhodanese-related sulfurtransferase
MVINERSGENGMAHRELKDQLYAQFARIGKVLASPQRLELLDLLAQGERSVEQLAQEAALSFANASQHLQVLRQARLVETRKAGVYVYYRLADPAVFALWRALRVVGERQYAEIDRLVQTYLHTPEQLEPISSEELRARLAIGDVLVLDVRPEVEYRQGHIAGARSMPLDELEAHLAELPPDREVVAYCRGPYCLFSHEAVQILAGHGFRARRLEDGFPEWNDAQLPVELGTGALQ